MMKGLVTIIFFSIANCSIAQSALGKWEMSSIKINETNYQIILKGKLPEGWHAYAQEDNVNELENLHLDFGNENIQVVGALLTEFPPTIVYDPLFSKKLKVYNGNISMLQVINIKGKIPATIRVNILGFASNDSEFLPIDMKCLQ